MALGPIHCGSFLLLAATVLLLVATISAPVVREISFLNITSGSSKSTFGVFGYCLKGACSPRQLGYNIATVSGSVTTHTFVNSHLEGLSKALILHPIATGIAFLSFLTALLSHRLGNLFASLLAFIAFLASLGALIIDFILFTIIRHEINNNTSSKASYGNAIWLVLVATVILFFAGFVVCFACVTGRRRDRDERYAGNGRGYEGAGNGNGGYEGRRWFRRGNQSTGKY